MGLDYSLLSISLPESPSTLIDSPSTLVLLVITVTPHLASRASASLSSQRMSDRMSGRRVLPVFTRVVTAAAQLVDASQAIGASNAARVVTFGAPRRHFVIVRGRAHRAESAKLASCHTVRNSGVRGDAFSPCQ